MRKIIYLTVSTLAILSCSHISTPVKVQLNDSVYWQIDTDATFDLYAGNITLKNCSPSFDGQPLAYKKFEIKPEKEKVNITYVLSNGCKVKLSFGKDSSTLVLSSQICETDTAPAYFSPMAFAKAEGASQFFKQGIGFGGPSGVFDIPKSSKRIDKNGIFEKAWNYDSYMTFGLFAENNTSLAVGTYNNSEMMHRVTFYNRYNRFGLIDRWIDRNDLLIDDGFSTEKIPLSGKALSLPDIHFTVGTQPFETMQNMAKNIAAANQFILAQKAAYHWC